MAPAENPKPACNGPVMFRVSAVSIDVDTNWEEYLRVLHEEVGGDRLWG